MPTVVKAAPIMVTNMTGFLIIRRGSSFLKDSPIAGPTIFQSNKDGAFCGINLLGSKIPRRGDADLINTWLQPGVSDRQKWGNCFNSFLCAGRKPLKRF